MEEIPLEDYKVAFREIRADEEKSGFIIHLFVYIVVNIALISIAYTLTPLNTSWLLFPVVGWGIGMAMHYFFAVAWIVQRLKNREVRAEARYFEKIKKKEMKIVQKK